MRKLAYRSSSAGRTGGRADWALCGLSYGASISFATVLAMAALDVHVPRVVGRLPWAAIEAAALSSGCAAFWRAPPGGTLSKAAIGGIATAAVFLALLLVF